MKRKLLTLFLALAMVLTMMPAMAFTAFADATEPVVKEQVYGDNPIVSIWKGATIDLDATTGTVNSSATSVASVERKNDTTVTVTGGSAEGRAVVTAGSKTYVVYNYATSSEYKYLNNLFGGKTVAVLGDSISTFPGAIPEGYACYYSTSNMSKDRIYWGDIINRFSCTPGTIEAYSGSTIGTKNHGMMTKTRIDNIGSKGTPDVILYHGGSNGDTSVGTFDPTADYATTVDWNKDYSSTAEAYAQSILRLKDKYPNATIVAIIPCHSAASTQAPVIKQIAQYYGLITVDLTPIKTELADLHPNKDGHTLMAKYACQEIYNNVVLNANGGTFKAAGGTTRTINNSTSYTLPKVKCDGKVFLGWFTEKTGGQKVGTKDNLLAAQAAGTTLYAHWTDKVDVDILLNANGGQFADGEVTKTVEKTETTLPTNLTRKGFVFVGWFKEDGTKVYGALDTTIDLTGLADGTKLYAHWTSEYTWDFNNGSYDAKDPEGNVVNKITNIQGTPTVYDTYIAFYGVSGKFAQKVKFNWAENWGIEYRLAYKGSATFGMLMATDGNASPSQYIFWNKGNKPGYFSFALGNKTGKAGSGFENYIGGTDVLSTDTNFHTYRIQNSVSDGTRTTKIYTGEGASAVAQSDYTECYADSSSTKVTPSYALTDLKMEFAYFGCGTDGFSVNQTMDYLKLAFSNKGAVTLIGNGGEGTSLYEYTQGTAATLPTDWIKAGYAFVGWYDNAECTGEAVTEISADASGNKCYWAKYEKLAIIQGDNQTITEGTKSSVELRSNAQFVTFKEVRVNGTVLDGKNYEVKSGSTIVTLKSAYVSSLKAGTYKVSIVSDSGSADATLTVKPAPNTGDNSNIVLYIGVAVLALLGIAVMLLRKRAYNK